MKLIIASNNQHKIREIKEILGSRFDRILSLNEAGIDHETVEDGTTFLENSMKKAKEITEIANCFAIADDSGLCVEALGGAPGIFSSRYCGYHGDDAKNREVLLEKMKNITDRKAYFACAIALSCPDGRMLTAEGRFHGEIAYSEKGENGFGYDNLFFVPEYGCTSAEMSPELKNSISHRRKALEKIVKLMDEAGII